MCHPLYLILRESLSLGTVLFSSVDNTRLPGSVCISNTSMCVFGEFGFPSLSPWQEEPPRQLRKADSGDVANTGFLHSSIFCAIINMLGGSSFVFKTNALRFLFQTFSFVDIFHQQQVFITFHRDLQNAKDFKVYCYFGNTDLEAGEMAQ